MAKDLSSSVRDVVTNVARDAIKNLGDAKPDTKKKSNGRLSGASGLAAGAGLAAMVPLAKKGVDAVRSGSMPTSPAKIVQQGRVQRRRSCRCADEGHGQLEGG